MRIEYVIAVLLFVIALIVELPIVPVTVTFPCTNSTSSQFSVGWYDSLTCYYLGVGTMYASGFESCYHPSGVFLSLAAPC